MTGNKENKEDQLQHSLDLRKDNKELDQVVNSSEDKDLSLLRETDTLLKSFQVESPSKGFSTRVMKHLDDIKVSKRVNVQGLVILFGVMIVVLITTFYLNSVSGSVVSIPEDVSVVGRNISLEGVGGLLNANLIAKGLMFVSLLLAMLIFDRAVLRPLLTRGRNFT